VEARSERMAGIGSIGGSIVAVGSEQERRFAEFVAAHRERAVGLAWRLVGGDAAAAEDVAQEAFVRAHRALAGFRGDASMSTWFYRILVNEAHRYRRWRWVRLRRAAEADPDPPDPRGEATGDPGLRARIGRALERLPETQRETFVLIHLEGFTVREAAEILGKATGTLKSHLHRALTSLRRELADVADTPEVTT
jgi:RNA polymerase sigma-70 factor (ECF subfamily)